MSTSVGNININLRANLTTFQEGMKEATGVATRETKKMSSSMREQTREARDSLDLLSGTIGIQIPRELKNVIATLPGVGSALASAFSAVAVLGVIELIVKVVQKVQEFTKKAAEAEEAWKKIGEAGKESLKKLDEELLQLRIEIENLRGQHLQALKDTLKQIDEQTLDKIGEAFNKLAEDVDKAFIKMKKGWFESVILQLGNGAGVENVKQQFDLLIAEINRLKEAGNNVGIGKAIDAEIASVKDKLATDRSFAGTSKTKDIITALEAELSVLNTMRDQYTKVNEERAGKSTIAREKEAKRVAEENKKEADTVQKLREEYRKLYGQFAAPFLSPLEKVANDTDRAEAEIRKMAAENPGLFKRAFPNDSVETVVASLQKMAAQAEDKEFQKALADISQSLNSLPKTLPDLGTFKPTLPTLAPDARVPSSAQQGLEKIKTDQKAAADEAQRVIDGLETENQKFEDQKARLNELRSQGLLTQQEYDKAMKQARDSVDKTSATWKQLGADIGDTIKQAVLFGRSWTDALKAILIEIVQVILQMTLLKNLGKGGGGGIGGFFGSLLGGLVGDKRADGGDVLPGNAYLVGERGPEIFAPGVSGSIIPNSGSGGDVQVIYQIDARGADISVEQRIRRAIAESENRAVTRAVTTVREVNRRQ